MVHVDHDQFMWSGYPLQSAKNLAVTILMHIFDCWNIPLVKSVSIILQYYYTFKCFKEAHKKYWAQTIYNICTKL